MIDKKIVICGSHYGGRLAVEALLEDKEYSISAFVCLTPKQAEKYSISGYYDYRELAEKHGISVYIPRTYTLKDEADVNFFKENKFDLIVQGGWQRLFPAAVLDQLQIGALGLHGSADMLPKGRGRSPMNWSLIEGKKRFLMHLFMIEDGVDDGDVIDVIDFDILEHDDIETLYYKYMMVYRDLLLANLPAILSGVYSVLPQIGTPSYYPKRTAKDGEIDWEEMDVWDIYNFVRGQTRPYPGAFAVISGKMVRLWKVRPFDTRLDYPNRAYGEVVDILDKKLVVRCRGGLLLLDNWEYI